MRNPEYPGNKLFFDDCLSGSYIFKDEWFNDKTVHDILEAWYWSSLFSGEYDKDQNIKMIAHLQTMVKTMQASSRKENVDWIANIKNYVLEAQNFSDEKFLLMEKADEDRIPKK